jgi:long-chain acyl-CoA synthetase
MPIQTLAELFLVASGYDKPELLMHQVGGKYTSISTKQFVGDVHRLAKALRALGVQRGDRVALMAENGPDWPLVDFASLCVGPALVPIYPRCSPSRRPTSPTTAARRSSSCRAASASKVC